MALLFIDGFDHYVTADFTKKWSYYGDDAIISTSVKRTGTGSYASSNATTILYKDLGADYQTLVAGFAFYCPPSNPYGFGHHVVYFDDGATNQIQIRPNTNKSITVLRNGTEIHTTAIDTMAFGVWDYWQAKVYCHATLGTIELKINGVTVINLTGQNTAPSGTARMNRIRLRIYGGAYLDDFYLDDANFLGDVKVQTLYPSGAGANTGWTPSAGSNYTCVDETNHNSDTDYVSTSTPDAIDTYAFGDVTVSGTIAGVQVNLMARMDDAGTNKIAHVVRPSTIDHVGDMLNLTQAYIDYVKMYNQNPDNAQAWTSTAVNGCEFGIKLIE